MLIETILGGITGILGNAIGAYFKYKDAQIQIDLQKAQFDHDVKMVQVETQAMIMEAKANIAITRAKVEGAIDLRTQRHILQVKQREIRIFSARIGLPNSWL